MERLKKLYFTYIFSLVFSIHTAIIVYSGSTFLSSLMGQKYIWIIYFLIALFSLVLNFSLTKILRTFHLESVTKLALVIAFLNMLNLYFANSIPLILLSYLIYAILAEYIILLASVTIEDLSLNKKTGDIRGHFIMMQSMGYIVSPPLTSLLIKFFSFKSIFLVSAILILASLFIFIYFIKHVPRIIPHTVKWWSVKKEIFKNHDLRTIMLSNIALQAYFASLVVYLPFKLADLGIPLTSYLLVALPVALVPFVVIPSFLGHLEDKFKNEKKFLLFSLFGMISTLILLSYLKSTNITVWAIALLYSRIWASIFETSLNSYFFKKINATNTAVISVFCSATHFNYLLIVPVLNLILSNGSVNIVFLTVSFLLTFMIVLVSKIHHIGNYEEHKTWKEIWRRSKKRI